MKIESIQQEQIAIDNQLAIATTVTFTDVNSLCILSRLMIEALGRPGKDNDLELMNSGDRCIAFWTQPQLSLEDTQNLINNTLHSV